MTATRADHEIGRRGVAAEAVGYLVEGSRRLYFAGDTDLFDGMAELGGGSLDLALLAGLGMGPEPRPRAHEPRAGGPCGGGAHAADRRADPLGGTFYPLGLARLRPRPLTGPPREFAARVRDLAPGVRVEILAPGASLDLGGS